jgi:O-antigen/teichoic acid export membrane protein
MVGSSVADGGLPRYTLAKVAKEYAQERHSFVYSVVRGSLRVSFGISSGLVAVGVLGAVLLLALSPFSSALAVSIMSAAVFAAFYMPSRISADVLKGLDRQSLGVLIEYGLIAIFAGAILVLFYLLAPIGAQANSLAPSVALMVAAIAVCLISVPRFFFRFRESGFRALESTDWKRARDQWAVGISQVLSARLPFIALPFFATAKGIGHFSAALNLTIVISILVYCINVYFLPKYARAKGQLGQLKKLYRRARFWALALASPVLIVIFIEGGDLLSLYGNAFGDGYKLLVIMALGQFVSVILANPGDLLTVVGLERSASRASLMTLAIGVVSILVLGPFFGLAGVAMAQAIVVSMRAISAAFICHRHFRGATSPT